jgi:hypothetical protein
VGLDGRCVFEHAPRNGETGGSACCGGMNHDDVMCRGGMRVVADHKLQTLRIGEEEESVCRGTIRLHVLHFFNTASH